MKIGKVFAVVVILVLIIEAQFFVLRHAVVLNREVITETIEVMGEVVDYLTGFGAEE